MKPHPLEAFANKLSSYDSIDLLATNGALQLMPENADRAIRLEAFAHAAASLPERRGKPPIGRKQLYRFCNTKPLGNGFIPKSEDPCPNLFTQAFPFHGGSFLVFPGIAGEATFILRHLMYAIFGQSDPFPDVVYGNRAQALLSGMLAVSTEIARRAGLDRGIAPVSMGNGKVVLPDQQRLETLKHAVVFSEEEFAALLDQVGVEATALDGLIQPVGQVSLTNYQVKHGSLLTHPLIRTKTQIIVALPGSVVAATNHTLIQMAVELSVWDELAKRYAQAAWNTLLEALSYLDIKPERLPLPSLPALPCSQDVLLRFDTDKLLYVTLLTDPFTDFESYEVFGTWPVETLSTALIERLQAIEEFVFSQSGAPNELLFLSVIQGVGRWHEVRVSQSAQAPSFFLAMSVAALQTIAFLERGDPLVLWKFVRASWQLQDRMPVIAPTLLDEFAVYRSWDYHYPVPALAEPVIVQFAFHGEGDLNREMLVQEDWHAIPFSPAFAVEVMRLYEKHGVPLYRLRGLWGAPKAVVVEGLPLPIWIIGARDEESESDAASDVASEFLPTIAYWLWQCTPSLAPLIQPLAEEYTVLQIVLIPPREEDWLQATVPPPVGPPLELLPDRATGVLQITLTSALKPLFARGDNEGERVLMRAVLQGIRALLPESERNGLDDDAITTILERHAPLGLKKMLLVMELNDAPDQDPRDLPPYRKVQQGDVKELVNEMMVALAQEGFPTLRTKEDWTGLYQRIVEWYFHELKNLVASLHPEGLLEWLVRYHETITYETARYHLSIPARLECFSSVPEMIEELRQEIPDASVARLASRFVIEYVVAQPPNGFRPMSLSVYDRLQALAAHIVNFGFESDLIHLNLVDPAKTEGGFLTAREQYMHAREAHLAAFASGHIAHARQALEEFWLQNKNSSYPAAILNQVEQATQAEFGHSFMDLIKLMANALLVGDDFRPSLAMLPLDDLLARLEVRLSWPRDKVQHALDLLSLKPRSDFFDTPGKESILPWQFNRALSYPRRPFLQRKRDGKVEVLWGPRHVYMAVRYLEDLLLSGRFKAQSRELQALMGEICHVQGELFNDQVAALVARNPNLIVRPRVEKVGSLKIGGSKQPLGDIDVLVADLQKRRVIMIECKDLALARTPREMANELEAFFEGKHGKKSTLEKHQRRVEWVRQHLHEVVTWLGGDSANEWMLESLIVVDQALFAPYLRRSPVRVVTIDQLKELEW